MPKIKYTENQIESLFKGIYSGIITPFTLPENLYKATANLLNSDVDVAFGDVDNELLAEMKNNIYMFSAAKTFQQVLDMQSYLTKDNEKLDYKTFRDRVRSTYDKYNEAYLETEYVTANTSANNAINYREALKDKEIFTQLRYVAILDQYTAPVCAMLNGTVAPTDSKFWATHTPPNHFNCRCHLEKIDKYEGLEPTKDLGVLSEKTTEITQPIFRTNSGITAKAFDKKHPYFNVPKKYKDLALRNFDLPIPNEK